MPAAASQVWGRGRVKQHFKINDEQYDELAKLIKVHMDQGRLLGQSFKPLAMRKRLSDCIKSNYDNYPSFIRQGPESEQLFVLVAMAQRLSYSYQKAQPLLHKRSDQQTSPETPPTHGPAAPSHPFVQSPPQTPSLTSPGYPLRLSPATFQTPQIIQSQPQAQSQTDAAQTTTATATTRPLELRTILVRNLVDPRYNGLCTVRDICRSSSDKQQQQQPPSPITIDDLDYDKWLEFLGQECRYDPDRHVLSYFILDEHDKVLIKSRWSWRAALQEISLTSGETSRFVFELMPNGLDQSSEPQMALTSPPSTYSALDTMSGLDVKPPT